MRRACQLRRRHGQENKVHDFDSWIGDGERWLNECFRRESTESEWNKFLRCIERDRKLRASSGKSHYIDMLEAMQAPADIRKFVREARRLFRPPKGPVVDVPLQTVESILEHKPENVAHEISPRPALRIHGDVNNLVSDWAKNPKKLVIIPEADRLLFSDPTKPVFNKVCNMIFDWIRHIRRHHRFGNASAPQL